jgi:hypothetical protein
MPRERQINDADREAWVDNDEGLYKLWRGQRLSKRAFVRAHRSIIDTVIRNVTKGREPAHYLAYRKKPT